jgi:lysozyme
MEYYDYELAGELMYDEGVRAKAYRDSKGYWTIGVGHYLGTDQSFSHLAWDMETIFLTFLTDLNSAIFYTKKQIYNFDSLSVNRQRVLVNMMFNLGPNRFAGFKKMIKAIHDGNIRRAYKEMLDSKWARQDVPNRARRLSRRWIDG